jgi:hypothetical protein
MAWFAESADKWIKKTLEPIDHVNCYLEMLTGFLVQAGIEVPGHRLTHTVRVFPKIRAENAKVLDDTFALCNWRTILQNGEFMRGTHFLMTDTTLSGTHKWQLCDRPEIFMAPAALGLTHTTKWTWWALSSGNWCPVLCCVCKCCSQWWWWWWWWHCGGGGGNGGRDGAGDLVVVQLGSARNVVVVVVGTVHAMEVQQLLVTPDR